MDRLWSPWRYKYVTTASPSPACIFCVKSQDVKDEETFVLHRAAHSFVMLNLYPYASGHVMIAPYAHVASLADADEDVVADIMLETRRAQKILNNVYKAPGYNVGMNIGSAAGAGIAGHIHMHVLPRWPGDANFMTSLADTRVIPEELEETYRRLSAAYRSA